jgi:hypothetical protein
MDLQRVRLMEHLAVDCPLTLRAFCDAMQRRLGLPEFACDCENETEWCWVEHEEIEHNVSRPFEPGTLQKWDSTVPSGCNFGVTLAVSQACPPDMDAVWSGSELVPRIAQALADLLGVRVYHHRTWLGVSDSRARSRVFEPSGPGPEPG